VLGLVDNVARLETESAFAVLARARALERSGVDVVHLEIGEPDFDTPAHVVSAAQEALRAGETGYCPTEGIPELREAAAAYLGEQRGLTIDPRRVLVGNGAKPFLFFTILACVGAGDEVIYPDPGFPIYRSAISWAGGVPVPLPLREERGFSFDPEELGRLLTPRTKLVILNSPNNPTGAVIPADDLRALASMLAPHDAWVLSDEVYSRIAYDGVAPSLASFPGLIDRTVLVDGCSKTFSMTGWRCGFAAVPDSLVDALTRFFVNCTSCVPPFVQRAAVAALTGPLDSVDRMRDEFARRRTLIVEGLDGLAGVRCIVPAGAFYAFPNITGTGLDDQRLAERLLEECGVAVLAGSSFGDQGVGHLRLSYAASQAELRKALSRMRGLLGADPSLTVAR
jgi:aspartate/methionine/tyrosine aminotransferase